jgi:hypothetical protein
MSIKLYHKAARSLQLPCGNIDHTGSFTITQPKQKYFFYQSITPFNNSASAALTNGAFSSIRLCRQANIPTIRLRLHAGLSYPKMPSLDDDMFPVTLRPNREAPNEHHSISGIKSSSELNATIKCFFNAPQDLTILAYTSALKTYRILVFDQTILGAYECAPACVKGNGSDTIENLIRIKNVQRDHLVREHDVALSPIQHDHECKRMLNERKINLSHVPDNKEIISLSATRHPRRGGDCLALSNDMVQANKDIVLASTKLFGLKLAEVVLVCEDINTPVHASGCGGGIEEIIHDPDIALYQLFNHTNQCNIASHILKKMILDRSRAFWRRNT